MQAVVYYLSLPFIYALAALPFWFLYRVSDVVFVIVFYLLKYRRDIVMTNLQHSFPEMSKEGLRQLERRHYRYFCDLLVETLKTLTISPGTARRRMDISGGEVLAAYYQRRQSVVLAMGHLGNWELAGARFASEPWHKLYVIYHPLRNKYFERLIYHMRTRLGNELLAMKSVWTEMEQLATDITATAFIADQAPARRKVYWTEFLHQPTPFFLGLGKAALRFNYPVIYLRVERPRRGYYNVVFEELVADPAGMKTEDIIEVFVRRLERDIRDHPELWLWTHKRWKHIR